MLEFFVPGNGILQPEQEYETHILLAYIPIACILRECFKLITVVTASMRSSYGLITPLSPSETATVGFRPVFRFHAPEIRLLWPGRPTT